MPRAIDTERHPGTVIGERLREAERELIATAVYARGAAASLVGVVTPAIFQHEAHRTLWAAVERAAREGLEPSPIQLIASGLDLAALDAISGLEFDVAGATSAIPALGHWRAANAASRAYALLQAAESSLARVAFTASAVTEATAGLAPALAQVARELVPERGTNNLREAVAEYVRSTRAGETRQVVGSWGLQVLDERLGSLRAGTMHIGCAFPGHGKSTLGLQAARATAARGRRVLYVTTEMLRHELAMRVLCAENGYSPRELERRIRADMADFEGAEVAELIVPEDRQRDVDAIAAMVRTARQQDAPYSVVVLDYLQMLTGPGETEYERLSYIAYRIKQLALDEGVACVVMAQVNRTADSAKLPSMRTLRGSSAIEDAADSVVAMYRMDKGDATGSAYEMLVRIDKARNGEPGDVATGPNGQNRIMLGAGTFAMFEPNRAPDELREAFQ